jgi:hypothetical protein
MHSLFVGCMVLKGGMIINVRYVTVQGLMISVHSFEYV